MKRFFRQKKDLENSRGIQPFDPELEQPFVIFHVLPYTDGPELIVVFNPPTPDRTEAIRGLTPSPIPFQGRFKAEVYEKYGVLEDGSINKKDFQKLRDSLVGLLGEQEGLVMESIYGIWGVKSGFTEGCSKLLMYEATGVLVKRGDDALILGCTEIPLLLEGGKINIAGILIPLIDTTSVVAHGLLEKTI